MDTFNPDRPGPSSESVIDLTATSGKDKMPASYLQDSCTELESGSHFFAYLKPDARAGVNECGESGEEPLTTVLPGPADRVLTDRRVPGPPFPWDSLDAAWDLSRFRTIQRGRIRHWAPPPPQQYVSIVLPGDLFFAIWPMFHGVTYGGETRRSPSHFFRPE